ncbi:MAG: carbohydrate-binding domain-containing protein, partial [Chloroflexi bacterium]|nr:carbohydrate-binding domain-containing protein [Chloroflexota bacterium]
MKKRILFFVTFLLIFTLTACSANTAETTAAVNEAQTLNVASTETTTTPSESQSATEVVAENSTLHEDAQDYVWDASAVIPILLNGDSISAEGQGVTVDGSTATITAAGTYSLTGSLSDGKIVVNSTDTGTVRLILNGASIYNSTSSPIYVQNAEKTIIVLADQTENSVSDGTSYVFESADEDEPHAAIFSKSDLTIYGNGTLTVNGNYNDGIASKDGLILSGGTVLVNAVDDGIRGKDYLVVKDGNITVT